MKRIFYIFCFGLFGLQLATLVHAAIEIVALKEIFGHPEVYAETIWWLEWPMIHMVAGSALWFVGLMLGIYGGVKFWDLLYVKKVRGNIDKR